MYNLNVLWLMPLHIPVVWFLGKISCNEWLRKYFQLCKFLVLAVIIIVFVSLFFHQGSFMRLNLRFTDLVACFCCLSLGDFYHSIIQKLKIQAQNSLSNL
jgi:hypothetical protein